MIDCEQNIGIDSEGAPIPYQALIDRINQFGGELSDDTSLKLLTNYFRPNNSIDPVIARKFNRLWSRIFSNSNSREKNMVTGAFNALAKTSLETVGELRGIPETQVIYFYRLGNSGLAFLKASLAPKPQEKNS